MSFLKEVQVSKGLKKVFCMDENYVIVSTFDIGTDFIDGENEYGQKRSNAESGVYGVGTKEWVEIDYPNSLEVPYGWAYVNIDDRGRALHGGGTGDYKALDAYQCELLPTLGCFRMYNNDVFWLANAIKRSEENGIDVVITVVD